MGFSGGIRPATPGTLVVLVATILLILVSVSTPLLKSIWFLKANIEVSVGSTDISGDVTIGAWGYCVDGTCTNAKLGYSLDIASLLGVNGKIAGLSNSVLKWITYLFILHPIAAAFGIISTLCGLLAHMHNFAGTALTTCFASFAATIGLLAFIFDIVVAVIAKKRIESSDVGGSAELGNAIWMTLAATILYTLAGCFFGFGNCIIRKRRVSREASEKNRPTVDEGYGSRMRNDALAAHEAAQQQQQHRKEGTLPTFAEHDRHANEQIPLNSLQAVDYDEDQHAGRPAYQPVRFASSTDVGAPSIISGVGEGYGRRNPSAPGVPVSLHAANDSVTTAGFAGAGAAGAAALGGAGSRLGAQARADRGRATSADEHQLAPPPRHPSTVEPFTGMYNQPAGASSSGHGYTDPYAPAPSTSPPPVSPTYGGALQLPVPNSAPSPSVYATPQPAQYHATSPSYGAAYPPYPSSTSPPPLPTQQQQSYYPSNVKAGYHPSTSPPPAQQQQQQYYVQNPSHPPPRSHDPYAGGAGETASIAPTYYTHDQGVGGSGSGSAYGGGAGGYGGGGGGGYGQVPSPVREMPLPGQASDVGGGGRDEYGVPYRY
ncbi:hypothetical protein JCM8097_001054 [Rhodosporidiobolus ruineniae]